MDVSLVSTDVFSSRVVLVCFRLAATNHFALPTTHVGLKLKFSARWFSICFKVEPLKWSHAIVLLYFLHSESEKGKALQRLLLADGS